jgi:sulfite reductase (NADPH) flavoprotein alpha-component
MEASNKHRYALYAAGAAAGVATYFLLKQEKSGARNQPTDFGSFLRVVPQAATETAKSTSFESFLRDQPVQPSSTDFASFLRSSGPVQQEQQQQQQHQQAHHQTEAVPEDAVPVLVIYGTEYGFAREISEKLAQQLKDTGSFWYENVVCPDTVFNTTTAHFKSLSCQLWQCS